MEFFSKHLTPAKKKVDGLPLNSLQTKPVSIEITTPLPSKLLSLGHITPVLPLAESTPLVIKNADIPKQVFNVPAKFQNCQQAPPNRNYYQEGKGVTENKAENPMDNTALNATINEGESLIKCEQHDSSEAQMKVLYENLQAEAKKIQQFKVQAMAQLKQKSDEISLKQSHIQSLLTELSAVKANNSELTTKLKKQSTHNEDIMNKVATTREMCFSIAQQYEEMKSIINVGEETVKSLNAKSGKHESYVQKAIEKVGLYRVEVDDLISQLRADVNIKERQYSDLIEILKDKERSLSSQIDYLQNEKHRLTEDIEKKNSDISKSSEEIFNLRKSLEDLQNTLVVELKDLEAAKNDDLLKLQTQLDENNLVAAETQAKLKQNIEALNNELSNLTLSVLETSKFLEEEKRLSSCLKSQQEELKAELLDKDKIISQLHTNMENQENVVQSCRKQLEDKDEQVKNLEIALLNNCNEAMESQAKLNSELMLKESKLDELSKFGSTQALRLEELLELSRNMTIENESLRNKADELDGRLTEAQLGLAMKEESLTKSSEMIEKLKDTLLNVEQAASTSSEELQNQILKLRESQLSEKAGNEEKISKLNLELQRMVDEVNHLKQQINDEKLLKEETLASLKRDSEVMRQSYEKTIKQNNDSFAQVQDEIQRKYNECEKKLELEQQKAEDLTRDLAITKAALENSLNDKNAVVSALAEKTKEMQEISNRLIVKDCEFSKLMAAVQNLKSKYTAVATPLTPMAQTFPDTCTVKPTAYSAPQIKLPMTPQATPVKSTAHGLMSTPTSGSAGNPAGMSTPRSSLSAKLSDTPKGILKNEGSVSKANRVAFTTPIEQKKVAPSDSETSVLDIEVVNKSFQLKSTPEFSHASLNKFSPDKNFPNVSMSPPAKDKNSSLISPLSSSQSAGERLPRSRAIKQNKKRPKSKFEKQGDPDVITKTMKMHKSLMVHGNIKHKAVRESDSDCFGFGSD